MYLRTVNDEESSVASNEPDVEYTEVVHPRPVDPERGERKRKYVALNPSPAEDF